jgi:hypothetical protein
MSALSESCMILDGANSWQDAWKEQYVT